MRSENDLRAAFAARAADAPQAEDVLRAVARAEQSVRPRGRRTWVRWLVPAVAVAAAVAIAVPLALGANGPGRTKAGARSGATAPSQAAAGLGGSAAGSVAPESRAAGAALAVCRPDQVRAVLTAHGNGATLTLTAGSTSCTVARVPVVVWPAQPPREPGAARSGARAPEAERPGPGYGILHEGGTASATIGWAGPCASPVGRTVQIDWGAGLVTVQVSGPSSAACAGSSGIPPRVGAFTGLS